MFATVRNYVVIPIVFIMGSNGLSFGSEAAFGSKAALPILAVLPTRLNQL